MTSHIQNHTCKNMHMQACIHTYVHTTMHTHPSLTKAWRDRGPLVGGRHRSKEPALPPLHHSSPPASCVELGIGERGFGERRVSDSLCLSVSLSLCLSVSLSLSHSLTLSLSLSVARTLTVTPHSHPGSGFPSHSFTLAFSVSHSLTLSLSHSLTLSLSYSLTLLPSHSLTL